MPVPLIRVDDLQPGDVFLYHNVSLLGTLIRLFDGSEYNHASIFDGDQVVESIAEGITRDTVRASVADTEYVHVYRYVDDVGRRMGKGEQDLSADPVVARVAYYAAHRERYAYEQLLLLAGLAATRRLPTSGVPFLAQIIRTVLDSAARVLSSMIAAGREPMICSELVYRCYTEAGAPYDLRIPGAEFLMGPGAPAAGFEGAPAGALSIEDEGVRASAAAFLSLYASAKGAAPSSAARVAPRGRRMPTASPGGGATSVMEASLAGAVPDFVTPRDLRDSPNLYLVGSLEFPPPSKEPNE